MRSTLETRRSSFEPHFTLLESATPPNGRLRRSCCHRSLVTRTIPPPSLRASAESAAEMLRVEIGADALCSWTTMRSADELLEGSRGSSGRHPAAEGGKRLNAVDESGLADPSHTYDAKVGSKRGKWGPRMYWHGMRKFCWVSRR